MERKFISQRPGEPKEPHKYGENYTLTDTLRGIENNRDKEDGKAERVRKCCGLSE